MELSHEEILAIWNHLNHEFVEPDSDLHELLTRIEKYLKESHE